jgi:DNA repair protein RecN (Recombination protein N)
MLKSLHISNYALISALDIDFEPGLTVITGETGAGKSIILGALSLILGQRADSKFIQINADKCVIEATFDISKYKHLSIFFTQNDLDQESNLCLIRREITASGKSRSFINDTPVSLNLIRDLSNRLIDIHSQHENLLLSNQNFQLNVVDIVAQNNGLLQDYQASYRQWRNLHAELDKIQRRADKQRADADYIQFQYNQLNDARLVDNELEILEAEQETLSHVEEIKTELFKSRSLLDDEQMILPLLKECVASIQKVKIYLTVNNQWVGRLESAFVELKDISGEITSFEERLEFDPTRLEFIETRLSEIYNLLKKYKVKLVSELIELRETYAQQLQQLDSFDDEIIALKKLIEFNFNELRGAADALSLSRKKAAKPIEDFLVQQLSQLGMPHIRFEVSFGVLSDFTEDGLDEVQFLFSANKNRQVQPVSEIASGGEVSRFMLTIKSLLAHQSDLPTIIFDEIDTGVSGEIAHRMGEIMKNMSSDMQVIVITHLPQIAARGNQHFRVFKDESGSQTETQIKRLNNDERIVEIAQMLSGKVISDAALKNATELLQN